MAESILLDPITRIEGHLAVKVEVEAGKVISARSMGEMFRGFEQFLVGRHPMDAHHITQRICGVCPISHCIASVTAQEDAYGVKPPANARIMRNLMLGANYVQSHILHFYQLAALDFVDIAAIVNYTGTDPKLVGVRDWVNGQIAAKVSFPGAPFLPRYESQYIPDAETNFMATRHYLEALDMRTLAHECVALFSGKAPHAMTMVPGGVTQQVDPMSVATYASNMEKLLEFVQTKYIPDVLAVARAFPDYFSMGKGCGNFLAYGVFPESDSGDCFLPGGTLMQGMLGRLDVQAIAEDVTSSRFSSPGGLHPSKGETVADSDKSGAYTWLKAPRYQGKPMEVGPLARLLVGYHNNVAYVKEAIDGLLTTLGADATALDSVLGRHAARALECQMVARRCLDWVAQLEPGKPVFTPFEMPSECEGYGLTEAARGALGHWISVKESKISRYQCVVPTTWNCSPRDADGVPGPVEQALVGAVVADADNPIEAARVVRAFDPCIACAVH